MHISITVLRFQCRLTPPHRLCFRVSSMALARAPDQVQSSMIFAREFGSSKNPLNEGSRKTYCRRFVHCAWPQWWPDLACLRAIINLKAVALAYGAPISILAGCFWASENCSFLPALRAQGRIGASQKAFPFKPWARHDAGIAPVSLRLWNCRVRASETIS